jgi:hypothetical protein
MRPRGGKQLREPVRAQIRPIDGRPRDFTTAPVDQLPNSPPSPHHLPDPILAIPPRPINRPPVHAPARPAPLLPPRFSSSNPRQRGHSRPRPLHIVVGAGPTVAERRNWPQRLPCAALSRFRLPGAKPGVDRPRKTHTPHGNRYFGNAWVVPVTTALRTSVAIGLLGLSFGGCGGGDGGSGQHRRG